MTDSVDGVIGQKLDSIAATLRHLLALELARAGASHSEIAAHLKASKSTVVGMLRGVKKKKGGSGNE